MSGSLLGLVNEALMIMFSGLTDSEHVQGLAKELSDVQMQKRMLAGVLLRVRELIRERGWATGGVCT